MRTLIFNLFISTCVFATVAQAQSRPSQDVHNHEGLHMPAVGRNHEAEIKSGERDFLLPGEGFANKKTIIAQSSQTSTNDIVPGSFPAESIVQYKSFAFGTTSNLHAFSGKYVSYLMADTMIGDNGLSREEIRELVDLTDVLYAHMAEIVGGEPSGDGLLTIALLNPGRDFGAKGWVGQKGVELYPSYVNKKDLLTGNVSNAVIHEMSHNFDIYNAYISHEGNNYHAWTAFLIPYAQYYTQAGASRQGQVVNPNALLAQTIDVDMDPWDAAGTSVTWNDCVKSGGGCWDKEIYANETWAGIVLRYARLHGAFATKQAFRFVSNHKLTHPTPPATAEAKNDVLVLAFAAGAGADVTCELNVWNWPVSANAAKQIKTDFPNQNRFCGDADNDGYSPALGDRNDFDASIRPGMTETVNGLDDDCDGIVDDVVLNEVEDVPADPYTARQVTIPSHIVGHTASMSDSDSYQIDIDTPRSINIWAKGIGKSFTGWFELRYASDPDTTQFSYLSSGSPAGSVVPLDRAGTWIVTVRPWAGANEEYEVFLSEVDPMPALQLRPVATSKAGSVFVNVVTDQRSLKEFSPTKVRLWAEGLGFIAEQRFEPTTMFKLKLPTTADIRLRAQLLVEDSPVSTATKTVTTGRQKTQPPADIFLVRIDR
ncbi:MAG TPA: MopE-related protein [Pyrinomonadaceae bacterium]|nr:MopE-related protein [Pyrinomonadaceae bacterium]